MKGQLFTYALTFIGSVGGLLHPFIGLLVYICFAIVRPEFMWSWSLEAGAGNYSRIVALAMLVGWAARGFGKWRFGRATPIIVAMLGYWAWMVVCAMLAPDSARAWLQVESFSKIFLPVLVGMTVIENMKQIKQLVWVILLSQGFVALQLHLYYYGGYNMAAEEGFGGMDNNCLAIAMVTGVGLAFFLGMGAKEWWKKAVAFGCAGLMAHVILFSYSRGGMLALALTGCVSFFLIPKKPQHYLAFVVAILLAIRLSGPEVRERFATAFSKSDDGTHEASAQSRIELWSAAFDATLKRPMFGIGPDNWGDIAPEYGFKRGKEVHSLWVQNAAELGIPGVLLLLSFFIVCLVKLWPIARERQKVDPWRCSLARMVFASLFGFVLAAQFVSIKYLEVPYYVALAGAAMLMLTSERPARAPAWSGFGLRIRPRREKKDAGEPGLTRSP